MHDVFKTNKMKTKIKKFYGKRTVGYKIFMWVDLQYFQNFDVSLAPPAVKFWVSLGSNFRHTSFLRMTRPWDFKVYEQLTLGSKTWN